MILNSPRIYALLKPIARVVKLVDTLGSGSSGRKAVLVRVQSRALLFS